MPPKKGKQGAVIDGVDTTTMTREQLESFAIRLRDEVEREREERSYFQLERDKIRTYWEIARQQLDETKAALRNKAREMEESEERNLVAMKHFKQSVKHLKYEHHGDKCDMRAEQLMALQAAQEDHGIQENELLRDKRELKIRLRDMDQQRVDQIRQLKLKHSQDISEARAKFEMEAREMEAKYEKKINTMTEELDTTYRMEITEVETRKNQHINDLIKNHESALHDLKKYYNDITVNNLALITSLQEQIQESREHSERLERTIHDLTAENKKLVRPLKDAEDKMAEMTRKMATFEKDMQMLAKTKTRLTATLKKLEEAKWENSALEMRYDKVKSDRDTLHERFLEAVLELQKRTGLKSSMLQRQVGEMAQISEHREAVMAEILAATHLDAAAVNNRLEIILSAKNNEIRNLQFELAKLTKANEDLLNTYESKLLEFGIPPSDLGFEPMRSHLVSVGKGSAGLVTKNQ